MRVLDRYIGRAVLTGTLIVLAVLLALFTFVSLLGELASVGKGQYGFWQALQYVILLTPRMSYQLLPVAAMIGTLLGLGLLANNSELTVMRAAGVTVQRIVFAAIKMALVLLVTVIVLSEYVAPFAEQEAQELRSQALLGQKGLRNRAGFWTRDSDNFISVDTVAAGGRLVGIRIYQFDGNQRLRAITEARSAYFDGQAWVLRAVVRSVIRGDSLETERRNLARWDSLLSPALLDVIDVQPDNMATRELFDHIRYLNANELNTARYEKALWGKLAMPLATVVMVLLAVPFVFGSLRAVTLGQRIMVGGLVGIGFYLVNEIFSYLGVVYDFNPVLSAMTPPLVFGVAALLLLRRAF